MLSMKNAGKRDLKGSENRKEGSDERKERVYIFAWVFFRVHDAGKIRKDIKICFRKQGRKNGMFHSRAAGMSAGMGGGSLQYLMNYR